MGNVVRKTNPILAAPKAATREQDEVRTIYRSRLEESPTGELLILSQLAPNGTDLDILKSRRTELLNSMRRGDRNRMATHIAEYLSGFANLKMDGKEAADKLSAYAAQVEHLPNWAVEKGCIRAAAQNRPFPLSAGELRALCDDVVAGVYAELSDLRKILTAQKYNRVSEDERERIRLGLAKLHEELKQTNAAFRPARRFNPNAMVGKTDAEIQRELKEVRLPQMSPALAAMFAPPPADASPDA